MTSIRDLEPPDLPALAALLGELGYPTAVADLPARLRRFLAVAGNRVLVIEGESGSREVVAFAALEITHPLHHANPVAHLSSFAVAAAARRRGLGRTLLAGIEEAARQAGCGLLVLTSADHRTDAHVFYPSAGYTRTGLKFARRLGDPAGTATGAR